MQWRRPFLSALAAYNPRNAAKLREEFGQAVRLIPAVEDAAHPLACIHILSDSFLLLLEWLEALIGADPSAEAKLRALKIKAALEAEALSAQGENKLAPRALEFLRRVEAVNSFTEVAEIARALASIAVPMVEIKEPRSLTPWAEADTAEASNVEEPYLIKVLFDVDRKPWSTPQVLKSGLLYDLHGHVKVPRWPPQATGLTFEAISTLDSDDFSLTFPVISRAESEPPDYEFRGSVVFRHPQSLTAQPLVLRLRATFVSGADSNLTCPVHIVGYHELNVKVFDTEQVPQLARYPSIDMRSLEIIQEIHEEVTGLDPKHLADFLEALRGVTNFMGVNLQQAIYHDGRSVNEAGFQAEILQHLRTLLGQDVQEAPWQGGGETDIVYRSTVIELKVEKTLKDRRKMIQKYLSQPTQYSSAFGSQLGILCILDLTEKEHPPAAPMNNITLETPVVHGFEDNPPKFPTRIAAVIIDGNLRKPSSYSR